MSEPRERGNKYDAVVGWVLPELRDLVPDGGRVEQETVRVDSVYFDTERHDLLRHGVVLRCRTGQADAGWQLTVPAGDARTEIRVDPTGSHTTVPKELAALTAGVRRGQSLRHIVTVHTDRTVHRVSGADDQVVVEVTDDRVDAVAPGRRAATLSSWREIAAELGPAGGRDVLDAVDARLTRIGGDRVDRPERGGAGVGCHRGRGGRPPAGTDRGGGAGRLFGRPG